MYVITFDDGSIDHCKSEFDVHKTLGNSLKNKIRKVVSIRQPDGTIIKY